MFFASDLQRVSFPTLPDGLLKGQANLGFFAGQPASTGDAPAADKASIIPQPEGRQARLDIHRTDYEGPEARGNSVATGYLP